MSGHTNPVYTVAWAPHSNQLATGSLDDTLIIWDLELSEPVGKFNYAGDGFLAVAWSPDGKRLAAGTGTNRVTIWDVEKQELIQLLDIEAVSTR